jgi:hypothetical protein
MTSTSRIIALPFATDFLADVMCGIAHFSHLGGTMRRLVADAAPAGQAAAP